MPIKRAGLLVLLFKEISVWPELSDPLQFRIPERDTGTLHKQTKEIDLSDIV